MQYPFSEIEPNPAKLFTSEDKKNFLKDPGAIDQGIRELADAINSVDVFVTMNSCQGFLIESEREAHCQETYVDFYVLNQEYQLANMFLAALVSKFNSLIDCKLVYEADYNLISEDEVEVTGLVNFRYGIKLYELEPDLMEATYRAIIKQVKAFAQDINK
ncbi:MAG: hypothetical protein ACOH15_02885 [Acetobacterium sp.]